MTDAGDTATRYAFGPWVIDSASRALTCEGRPVVVASRAFDVLHHLVANAGRLVSKDEIGRVAWGDRMMPDANLNQLVFTLRKSLSAEEPGQRYIVTEPGRGYRFAGEVKALAPDPAEAPIHGADVGTVRRRKAPTASLAMAAALVALLGALGVGAYLIRGSSLPKGRTGVVVADFDNGTGDAAFDRFPATVVAVDLRQSPFLDVLSDRQVRLTLALMAKPPEARLTPDLAAQVCARNQGGAAIGGGVAAVGSAYLVTLTATDCLSGRVLAQRKAQAPEKSAVPGVLDRLAGQVRRSLGESRGSIQRFSVPLLSGRTASFDALVSYSQASWLFAHGRRVEALPLYQHAVDIDPRFASGWAALAADFENLREADKAAAALTRAYALRDLLDEHEKLHVALLYQVTVTRDLEAALSEARLQTTLYPKDPVGWANLSNLYNTLGRYALAVEPAKRALALDPTAERSYTVLARAYARNGQLAAARAVAEQAIARKVAGEDIRKELANIAYGQGDEAEVGRQLRAVAGTPAERALSEEAAIEAFSDGRAKAALALFVRHDALGAAQGVSDTLLAFRARVLDEMGLITQAKAVLKSIAPTEDTQDLRFDLAKFGDAERAKALLKRDLAARPSDTLLVGDYKPSLEAALLLRGGHAREAAAALKPAWAFAAREFDIPYQQGYADLAAGDAAGAARSFRYILDNPGHEPHLPELPLARLGLARALKAEGDMAGAKSAYRAFLDRWKNADADLPILMAAKREAAALGVKA